MVTAKKQLKAKTQTKRKKASVDHELFDDLYVSMSNPQEKRKNILFGIKNALVMQDEYEKLLSVRSDKYKTISEIKKDLNSLNNDYQNLKKLLPNVKNVLSFTETELNELDNQIDMLSSDINSDKQKIKTRETLKTSITGKKKIIKEERVNSIEPTTAVKPEIQKHIKKTNNNFSKLDRIRNNLKVIESKLDTI